MILFEFSQPEEAHRRKEELQELIKEGRAPISLANINLISADTEKKTRDIISSQLMTHLAISYL
jgi:hypothetical protein